MPTTKPKPRNGTPVVEDRFDWHTERRAALVRDIEAILDAETWANLDRKAIGFPTDVGYSDTPGGGDVESLNAVEAAAVLLLAKSDRATDWLSERREALAQVVRVANLARANWGAAPKTGTIGGVTIGARTSTAEPCGLCNLPVLGGRDDPLKRIDGVAYHVKSGSNPDSEYGKHGACYYTAGRSKGLIGRKTP